MSLGISANQRKNGALLAYIANKIPGINLRKLLKIIYLIDERFVELRGFPLTWFDYYVWEKGPVAPEIYDIKTDNRYFARYVKAERDSRQKVIISPVIPVDKDAHGPFGELSDFDLAIVDEQLAKYGDKSADWLTDQTHLPDALWTRTRDEHHVTFLHGKSDCLINLKELLAQNPDLSDIYDEAAWSISLQAALNT